MGSYTEIAMQIKRFGIMSMKSCYRSVKGHPFLVGSVLFLMFLYRSFPFLFSLLLSASPVLVCTALLLGTLLSFGQPNIPEIEKEESLSRDVVSPETNETFVVDRDASFVIERYVGEDRRDLADKSVEDDVQSPDSVPLIDETSRENRAGKRGFLEFEFEKNEILEEEVRIEEGALSDGRIVENHYSLVRDVEDEDNLATDVGKVSEEYRAEDRFESYVPAGCNDDEIGNHRDEDDEDNEDEEDEDNSDGSSFSDSDRAESSSPDASMADIIPMLDELHPLLDLGAPQPAHMSRDRSDDGSGVSDHGDEAEEDGVDDHEDDEEEAHGGKEDESKSAIIWTEDDQKNLMDLGTSELERNQRLENLIARRRARKSFRLMAEKNLIDLDSIDLPFNVPQISTARRNPFDLPDDSYEQMGLPPIPGSAPSIMLPRRNPFDLPYDSNEEKPDLKGDSFEQEFLPLHQKEMMFRRHESFSLGPSGFGGSRHDARWKPVFVPERLASERASYSLFQRQSSEVSDSKLSSVPDTDSVTSVADTDEKKLGEQDLSKEAGMLSEIYQASDLVEHQSRSFEDEDSMKIASERRQVHHEEEVKNDRETGHYLSESREISADLELNTSDIHVEEEQVEEDRDSSGSSLSSLSEGDERYADVKEDKPNEEGDDSGKSSSSLSSEVDEKAFDVKNEDGLTSALSENVLIDESFISSQPSLDDDEIKTPVYDSSPRAVDRLLSLSSICSDSDTQVEVAETVKVSSSIEVASSVADRETELNGSTEINVSNVASSEVAPEIDNQTDSVYSSSFSSEIKLVEESRENEGEHNPSEHGSSAVIHTAVEEHENQISENWEMVHEEMIHADEHRVQSDSSSEKMSIEEEILEDKITHPQKDEVPTSSSDPEIQIETNRDLGPQLEVLASVQHHTTSDDSDFSLLQEGKCPSVAEQVHVANKHEKEHPVEKHETVWSEPTKLNPITSGLKVDGSTLQESDLKEVSSSSDDDDYVPSEEEKSPIEFKKEQDFDSKVDSSSSDAESVALEEKSPFKMEKERDSDLKLASSNSDDEYVSSKEKSPFKSEEELSSSDKPVVEPNDDDDIELHVSHEPSTVTDEAKEDSSNIADKVLAKFPRSSSDSSAFPTGSLEYKPLAGEIDLEDSILDRVTEEKITEEVDEINDIDEGLLHELDAVGDFGIRDSAGISEAEILKEASTELPVLEVRSFEDIDLAFKQLHEGADVKEQAVVEVVEAKPFEEIQTALRQVSDRDVDEQSNSKNESAEEVESVELEAGGVEEVDPLASDDPKHQDRESLEDSNTSSSKNGDNKSKDRLKKSGSSSSSSSSSSPSSSDSE